MALMACPECGRTISTRAYMCPHCGLEVPRFSDTGGPRYDSILDWMGAEQRAKEIRRQQEKERVEREKAQAEAKAKAEREARRTAEKAREARERRNNLIGCFVILFIIVGSIIYASHRAIINETFKRITNEIRSLSNTGTAKESSLVDIESTPRSQRPAMYVPAIRLPNQNCIPIYLCTEKDYNPKEWRVIPKAVSRTFDGGKTWHTVWGSETSRYIIRDMKAVDSRNQGERDIILIIEEP